MEEKEDIKALEVKYMNTFAESISQCLKWTVAQSPNATNILFGRPKAAPN